MAYLIAYWEFLVNLNSTSSFVKCFRLTSKHLGDKNLFCKILQTKVTLEMIVNKLILKSNRI